MISAGARRCVGEGLLVVGEVAVEYEKRCHCPTAPGGQGAPLDLAEVFLG